MCICGCGWVHACIHVGVNLVCAVDCYVSDIVFFFRNGSSMGVAFDTVKTGPGFAYFPAFSLSMGENVHVNFGATPLRYPCQVQTECLFCWREEGGGRLQGRLGGGGGGTVFLSRLWWAYASCFNHFFSVQFDSYADMPVSVTREYLNMGKFLLHMFFLYSFMNVSLWCFLVAAF